MHEDGKTLDVIGGVFGMNKQNASDYNAIVAKIPTEILDVVERSMSDGFSVSSDTNITLLSDGKSDASDMVDWSFRWFQPLRIALYPVSIPGIGQKKRSGIQ